MNKLDEKINHLDNKIPKWFAIYTHPRTEKSVYKQLQNINVETYLPLKRELKEWSNRTKNVEIPLFPSYIFVKVTTSEYYKIPKAIVGFLRFVLIGGDRISIREEEIETIKLSLQQNDIDIDISNEHFAAGEKIEITKGILKGKIGKLIEYKGNKRIALKIESLQSNVIVDIDRRYLKKIG